MDEVSSPNRLDLPFVTQGRSVDCSASSSTPMMEGPGADSEEKHEPVSDIDTAVVVVCLKALDPEWPIREAIGGIADIPGACSNRRAWTHSGTSRGYCQIEGVGAGKPERK